MDETGNDFQLSGRLLFYKTSIKTMLLFSCDLFEETDGFYGFDKVMFQKRPRRRYNTLFGNENHIHICINQVFIPPEQSSYPSLSTIAFNGIADFFAGYGSKP